MRARLPRRLFSAEPDHQQLIDLLVGSRLVTSDAGVVEIAHEALARAWPRLRTWLDEDMEGQRIWLELDPGRHDAGRWTCSSEIAARYLPAVCRP